MEQQNGYTNGSTNETVNGINGSSSGSSTCSINGSDSIKTNGYPMENGGKCPKKVKPIYLTNLQDESLSVEDTLHAQAVEVLPHLHCKEKICVGSLMRRDGVFVKEAPSKEFVWDEAQKFLNEYYSSLPEKVQGLHKQERMQSVYNSIMSTGSYSHTIPELTYGAQLAWRNAPRCVGRIQWANMQMFDCRHAKSTLDMYNAICQHIKYATNRGIIRSAITVFDCTRDNITPCKIWSPQFISYAGYHTEDGGVLGDPSNLEFTKICLKLGWKGRRTRFDILPLVLQYGDDDPEYFHLPRDIVQKVKLRHPTCKEFANLDLEWYCVPAVCNMLMDCGGLVYNTCGFSGWYMTTEIVRDLTDPSRYNLLTEIAETLGYDTNQPTVYWKDRAAVELNVAVAYSFQKDRVTIVDQHTASESFMRHLANETKTRGGCPGDWVWINPPIGGSLTQVHHQEMLNYKLKPGYDYQPPPWLNHVWKDITKAKRKLSFKSIARSISLTAMFMTKALLKRIPCTILYASETGTSEHFAQSLRKVFNQVFNAKVICMSDYDYTQVKYETLIIVIASTFGNGDAPENGRTFLEVLAHYVAAEKKKGDHKLVHQGSLNNQTEMAGGVRFAVFGLGSSAYPQTYCEFARQIDEYLADGLSFDRIMDFATGDALKNQEKEFSQWSGKVFQKACDAFCVDVKDVHISMRVSGVLEYNANNYKVCKATTDKISLAEGLKFIHNKNVIECSAKSVKALTTADATKETILVKLNHNQQQLAYRPGDHVAVFPVNIMDDVELILQHTILPAEVMPTDLITIDMLVLMDDGKKKWEQSDRLPVCSMRDALIHYLDIDAAPSQSIFKQLVANSCVDDEAELEEVKRLSQDDLEYRRLIALDKPGIANLIRRFPSIYFPPSLLLTQVPLLRPRFYSVSSSPKLHPSEIHITASVLDYTTPGLDGVPKAHHGLCTNWMKKLEAGTSVYGYIRSAQEFWLPDDPMVPVIMVGPGSGVAPFRSFWQERICSKKDGNEFGAMEMFYGCRGLAEQCYREEMEEAKGLGVFSEFHIAFSRKPGVPKTYVQHQVAENGERLKRMIQEEGAYMYVCGDITMANDVATTVNKLLADGSEAETPETPKGAKKAQTQVEKLKAAGRYREDIYGVSSAIEGAEKLQGM